MELTENRTVRFRLTVAVEPQKELRSVVFSKSNAASLIRRDGLQWIAMDCNGLQWIAVDCSGLCSISWQVTARCKLPQNYPYHLPCRLPYCLTYSLPLTVYPLQSISYSLPLTALAVCELTNSRWPALSLNSFAVKLILVQKKN